MARIITMRAWCMHRYGGPEELVMETVPAPQAGAGELLVKVAAASVNPIDWRMREGQVKDVFAIRFPRILGRDCAGVVVQSEANGFLPGDRVLAVTEPLKNGTHAEYAVVPAALATRIPPELSDIGAVAIGNSGATAWIALVEIAEIGPAQRVLVHAAAGGVGGLSVQLARHFGAEVFATCSQINLEYVRSLGAHRAIDYAHEDFVRASAPCDVVFDTLGGQTHQRSFDALRPGGMLVYVSAEPIDREPPHRNARVVHAPIRATGERLACLLDLAAMGAIKPQIGRVFACDEAAAAYAASQGGHSRGKNVIVFAQP